MKAKISNKILMSHQHRYYKLFKNNNNNNKNNKIMIKIFKIINKIIYFKKNKMSMIIYPKNNKFKIIKNIIKMRNLNQVLLQILNKI